MQPIAARDLMGMLLGMLQFARLAQLAQEDLETMAQELEVARAEAHAKAAEAEDARKALQQVGGSLR